MSRPPTARELQVFAACLRHRSQKLAGYELGISQQTVKNHCQNLYRKLDVDCASQAAEVLGWLIVPNTSGG
jgi:DNA-binding CsgD family transcriptional regulator